ncbi:MAG: hypothetical protein PHE15_00145 [Dehalococcoidales bacterium]|nr:hypothetical protein [Dehalococcoidales bacterium]
MRNSIDNNWSDMTPKYIKKELVLSDNDYAKLVGQAGLQLNAILKVFDCYGMSAYIPGAKELILGLMENFGQAVRGDKHKPIHVIDKPLRRPTE